MEKYKPIFRRTFDLLEKHIAAVDKDRLTSTHKDISEAASEFEKEMLQAASDELTRIKKMKRQITGIWINIESYRPSFMMAFYLLEKYHSTICDERWSELAQELGGAETKFEVAMMVAVVGEIERIYKANLADQQQQELQEKAEDRHTA